MAKIDKKALNELIHAEKSRISIKNMGYKDKSPPFVSVVGPENSGKSTLLNSIFQNTVFTQPVTKKIKNKKLTFYESTSNLENLIDTLKISDLILFTVNLKTGLQKDTLEAINIMNSTGVPKFCFVLTNFDQKKGNTKSIENRIQKEFSFPVRFFNLKISENKNYYENINLLIRYIENMKYRPVEWKCIHPYIVVDKIENDMAFGYVRGGPIESKMNAHIPGHGDFYGINIDENSCDENINEIDESDISNDENSDNDSDNDISCNENTESCDDSDINNDAGSNIDSDEVNYDEDSDIDTNNEDSDIDTNNGDSDIDTNNEDSDISNNNDLEMLKSSLKNRFKSEITTENDLIDKFNDEFKENQKDSKNILEKMKNTEILNQKNIEQNKSLILPGKYVKFNLKIKPNKFGLIILGSILPTENNDIFLKGKIVKNKWQTFDLKSNAPYFFSIGWYRYQSIPIFSKNDRFMKYCKNFSEILFYGRSVPLGTSFLVYSYDSSYKILGTGQILNISGKNTIKKKLKLIGHPKTIIGQNVIVQSMFSSSKEANKFINGKLNTVSGLRGLIKSSIGKDGCFRAVFEGKILMSETIFLKCLVPVEPFRYLQHTKEGINYVRHLKELKINNNCESNECDSDNNDSSNDSDNSCDSKTTNNINNISNNYSNNDNIVRDLKKIRKNLPFEKREIKNIVEKIDLPIPPEKRKLIEKKQEIEKRRIEIESAEKSEYLKKQKYKLEKYNKTKFEKQEKKRKVAVETFLKKKHKRSKSKSKSK